MAANVRVTYWAGRGRCEPLRCIIAAAGCTFTNVFFDAETGKEELDKLRASGKLAYDQLPLIEMDGLNLVQTSATATYLGRRFDLLPTDPAKAYRAESIYASSQDARGCLLSFPFSAYPSPPGEAEMQRVMNEMKGPKGLIGRYVPKWECMLSDGGGPFFLGATPSIADIGVFECVDYVRDVFGANEFARLFEPFPLVRALVVETKKLGRLADHCDVERTKYDTWDGAAHSRWVVYANAVRTTLA